MSFTHLPKPFADNVSEAEFQDAIIALAQAHGWWVHAERHARTAKGWRTPIQGDKGFPDLVLARDIGDNDLTRITRIFWEVKSAKGRVTAAQRAWIDVLGGEADVVYPKDWGWICEVLE